MAVSFAGVPDCFIKAANYLQIFIHIFFWGTPLLSLKILQAQANNWGASHFDPVHRFGAAYAEAALSLCCTIHG